MSEPKSRARLSILSNIAQFSLQRYNGAHPYSGSRDMSFQGGHYFGEECQVGDLVALQSAPTSKWYLSWLRKVTHYPGGNEYLLESIEDGALCNWSNVSLIYLDRSWVANHPGWQWTDRQHQFNDRWLRVCHKERDAWMYLPTPARFDGDAVELGVRVRYGLSDTRINRRFDNWRKTTKKLMLAFYDEAAAELKAEKPKKSAAPAPTVVGDTREGGAT